MIGIALLIFLSDTALGVLIFLAIASIIKLWDEQEERTEHKAKEAPLQADSGELPDNNEAFSVTKA